MDRQTTVQTLKDRVEQFVREREWEQFHTPKNLTVAVAIEAAELMEIFQWATAEQSVEQSSTEKGRERLEEELADVLIFCLALANRIGIDLSNAVRRKVERNADKYPADNFRGRY